MVKAAEALNVQPSAVSMQMKSLADFVGVPLIAKAGRGVELTSHGQALLPAATGGLGRIDDAVAALRKSVREQAFTLSVLPAFLHRRSYYWVSMRSAVQDPRQELMFGWLKGQAKLTRLLLPSS